MRQAALQELLGSSLFGLQVLEADGDCFYSAVSRGLDNGTTKEALRDLVASSLTHEMFENYKAIAFMDGYEWAGLCESLADLQDMVRRPKKVWADENAINAISNGCCGVSVLMIDEEGVEGSGGSGRRRARDGSGSGQSSKFVKRGSFADDDIVIMVCRSRRQHFNLVTYSGVPNLGLARDLPQGIRGLFTLSSQPLVTMEEERDDGGKYNESKRQKPV